MLSGIKWGAVAVLVLVLTVSGLVALTLHYHGKSLDEQQRATTAQQQADTAQTVTSNVLRTVGIINKISEANQNAHRQISLDAQTTTQSITMAIETDGCAARPVPVVAADRLRAYADSLRASSGGSAAVKSDR